jgi:long-chain acyl-CoA synthetase
MVLPPDTPVEICIQGPCVMSGYRNDAQAADEALQDGWLRTGARRFTDCIP